MQSLCSLNAIQSRRDKGGAAKATQQEHTINIFRDLKASTEMRASSQPFQGIRSKLQVSMCLGASLDQPLRQCNVLAHLV